MWKRKRIDFPKTTEWPLSRTILYIGRHVLGHSYLFLVASVCPHFHLVYCDVGRNMKSKDKQKIFDLDGQEILGRVHNASLSSFQLK